MKTTENMDTFTAACLDTSFNAIAVKKRERKGLGDLFDFGILVEPYVMQGRTADTELDIMMSGYTGTVTVRGHGWLHGENFVWTGDAQEFRETWEID